MNAARKNFSLLAPAKINLYLEVTGQRADSYHKLESLVAFADIGDSIEISESSVFSFETDGPFSSGFAAAEQSAGVDSANLAVRAAWRLAQAAGRDLNLRLRLTKSLPLAAGIGGGSADAAAVLRGLLMWWGMESQDVPALDDIMLALGADVPVCFHGGATFVSGIGEKLTPAPDLPALPLVLVNPGVACPTARVFAGLARGSSAKNAVPFPQSPSVEEFLAALEERENALTAPAIALAPEIATVLEALRAQEGCALARMSGSGATCFGLFRNQDCAARACAAIACAFPHWWAQSGWLNRSEKQDEGARV